MNDKYLALSSSEKERFAKVANYLLNKSFVLREIYEIHDRIGKFNPDYRFLERHYELMEEYLEIAGYSLVKDDALGIIEISSKFEFNLFKLDKFSTLALITMRQLYDEESERNPSKNVILLTTTNLVLKMMENNLIMKKPTIKDCALALKLFMKHNIITKFSGDIDEADFSFLIYPTILKVVSNEKLTAIYNIMLKNQDESGASES